MRTNAFMSAWTKVTEIRATSVPKIQPCLLLPIPANTTGRRQEQSRVMFVMEVFLTLNGSGWFSSAELKGCVVFFFFKWNLKGINISQLKKLFKNDTNCILVLNTSSFRICPHLMIIHVNSYLSMYIGCTRGKNSEASVSIFTFWICETGHGSQTNIKFPVMKNDTAC